MIHKDVFGSQAGYAPVPEGYVLREMCKSDFRKVQHRGGTETKHCLFGVLGVFLCVPGSKLPLFPYNRG